MTWPAAAHVYLTWEYAIARANEQAAERGQRVYVYRTLIGSQLLWLTSWDPRSSDGP